MKTHSLTMSLIVAFVVAVAYGQEGATSKAEPGTPAAPFGLTQGMPKAGIANITQEIGPSIFRLSTVPKPHAAFEWYVVQAPPKTGLCWVKALGNTVSTSSYGSELEATFSDVRKQVDSQYGASRLYDFLKAGSLWNEPREWMMGLLKKERVLAASWSKEDGSSMKPTLRRIQLVVNAIDQSRGFITLEYEFDNFEACQAELKSSQQTVF